MLSLKILLLLIFQSLYQVFYSPLRRKRDRCGGVSEGRWWWWMRVILVLSLGPSQAEQLHKENGRHEVWIHISIEKWLVKPFEFLWCFIGPTQKIFLCRVTNLILGCLEKHL